MTENFQIKAVNCSGATNTQDRLSNLEKRLATLEERLPKWNGKWACNCFPGSFESLEGEGVKVAMIQMMCSSDKQANIARAKLLVEQAADAGAEMVVLPEIWNGPYDTSQFENYSEPIPAAAKDFNSITSPTVTMLRDVAKEKGIYLIGGSVSECEGGNVYNTSTSFSPDGELLAKHRKMHLFDIDVPGKITFRESDTLTAGDSISCFDTPFGKVGVGICYDIRFAEQAMLMRQEGCKVLVYPGAFNMTTGPKHWELLARGRAVDNQSYVLVVSPARNPDSGYQAWGHTTCIGPWGDVKSTTEHGEAVVLAKLDMSEVDTFRTNIPLPLQKRFDLYDPVQLKSSI